MIDWEIKQGGMVVASGSSESMEVSEREAWRYALQYVNDGPFSLRFFEDGVQMEVPPVFEELFESLRALPKITRLILSRSTASTVTKQDTKGAPC